jgi:hypothetical protein
MHHICSSRTLNDRNRHVNIELNCCFFGAVNPTGTDGRKTTNGPKRLTGLEIQTLEQPLFQEKVQDAQGQLFL